jgi:hypothetical protein
MARGRKGSGGGGALAVGLAALAAAGVAAVLITKSPGTTTTGGGGGGTGGGGGGPPPTPPPPCSAGNCPGSCEQDCPCGKVWDSVLCECSALEPAAILVPASDSVSLGWMAAVDWLNNVAAVGIMPANPNACPGSDCSQGDWTNDTWEGDIPGQVVDAAGHPICGATVLASLEASLPWQAGGMAGTVEFTTPGTATTGADGSFSLPVYAKLTVSQGNASVLTNAAGSGGGSTTVVLSVSYRVQGTVIQATTVVDLDLLVCSVNLPTQTTGGCGG